MMNKYRDSREYVAAWLNNTALLGQLAEETAELGKAALKLQRVLMNENPTPVTMEEALDALIEEIADVICAMEIVMRKLDINLVEDVEPIIEGKAERWADRVRKKHEAPSADREEGEAL